MAISVVVNCRRLAFIPAKYHQIESVIASIDQVPCVPLETENKIDKKILVSRADFSEMIINVNTPIIDYMQSKLK
jgi:hypothetical protein